jgi:hypothetical protein
MISNKSHPEDEEANKLPSNWALTVPLHPPCIAEPVQCHWHSRARAELPVTRFHFKQRVALEKRGVVVPYGKWVALDDPSTADPRSFNPDRLIRTDTLLVVIKVTAALALEIAVRDEGKPLGLTSAQIARDLYKAGLKRPGGREEPYSRYAVERWRKDHKACSGLYRDGSAIFRSFKAPWTVVLNLACVEARMRASLHKMHRDDPDGSKTLIAFQEWVAEFKAGHEQWYREQVMSERPIRPKTRAWLNALGQPLPSQEDSMRLAGFGDGGARREPSTQLHTVE